MGQGNKNMQSLLNVVMVLCTFGVLCVHSYPHYHEFIPNGDKVPHPYLPGRLWRAVPHVTDQGNFDGRMNPFGEAFMTNRMKWDECLCGHDSDKDGRSNGDELGDPYCTWQPGLEPYRTTNLSHPGVCEPIDSSFCKAFNDVEVVLEPVHCAAFKRDSIGNLGNPIETLDLTIRRGAVSMFREDQWGCVYRDFAPNDPDIDLVAARFVPDNLDIVFEMEIFGCNADDTSPSTKRLRGRHETAHRCIDVYCEDMLMKWKIGKPKLFCIDEEYKFTFGEHGYDQLLVRWRFRNALGKPNLEDHSSLILYWNHPDFAPGVNQTGFMHYWGSHAVAIPAGYKEYHHEGIGICPEMCTLRYGNAFNVTHLVPYMLRYGRVIKVTHTRRGKFEKIILETTRYDYEKFPKIYRQDPPIVFYPGDEIRVDCIYDTSNAKYPAVDGFVDPVGGEHCLVGIRGDENLSKRDGVNFCKSNNGLGACSKASEIGDLGECVYGLYVRKVYDYSFDLEKANCDKNGLICNAGCSEAINTIINKEPCLMNKLIFPHMLRLSIHGSMDFVKMVMSCSSGSALDVRNTQVRSGECGVPVECLLSPIVWDKNIIP